MIKIVKKKRNSNFENDDVGISLSRINFDIVDTSTVW